MSPRIPLLLSSLAMLLSGCDFITGKEVARLAVDRVSTAMERHPQEATLMLEAQDQIAVWSDMDLAYDGDMDLLFVVEVLRDSEPIEQLRIDPSVMNITVRERMTVKNGRTERSYNAKHEVVKVDTDGRYTFRAVLLASDTSGLRINKAQLVLRK